MNAPMIAAHGRAVRDAMARETRTGNSMGLCTVAVDIPLGNAEDGESETLFLGLVAFGRTGETLARVKQGESVTATGRLQRRPYRAADGTEREGWQCIADTILTARSVRPGQRRQSANGERSERRNGREDRRAAPPLTDDELPF